MPTLGTMAGRQLMLLTLILVGIATEKLGILNEKSRTVLSDLLIKVFMPCSIVAAFFVERPSAEMMEGFTLALAIGFLVVTLLFFLAKWLYRNTDDDTRPALQHGLAVNNIIYVGVPVIQGFFGVDGLLYLSALIIPFNIFMWGFGPLYFEEKGAKVSVKKILFQPVVVALAIGLVLLFTGLRAPIFLEDTVRSLGVCTTPVALMIIGGILAGVSPKSVVTKQSLLYCLVRLVLVPLGVLALLLPLHPSPILGGTLVVAFGMPMAVATAVLSAQYNKAPAFASKLIFLSTLFSMVTLPLLALLANNLLA